MGNLDRLVTEGALDPDARNRLEQSVIDKIEAMSKADIDTVIKFHLDVSPKQAWEPDPDGSIF